MRRYATQAALAATLRSRAAHEIVRLDDGAERELPDSGPYVAGAAWIAQRPGVYQVRGTTRAGVEYTSWLEFGHPEPKTKRKPGTARLLQAALMAAAGQKPAQPATPQPAQPASTQPPNDIRPPDVATKAPLRRRKAT